MSRFTSVMPAGASKLESCDSIFEPNNTLAFAGACFAATAIAATPFIGAAMIGSLVYGTLTHKPSA